jgi:hypothetical protein
MTDRDPIQEYERSHEARRGVAWAIIAFYAVTIVWAAAMAFDK